MARSPDIYRGKLRGEVISSEILNQVQNDKEIASLHVVSLAMTTTKK